MWTGKGQKEFQPPPSFLPPKRWLMNSSGLRLWVPFPVPAPDGLQVKEHQLEARPLDIWGSRWSRLQQVLCLQIWEFSNEAEQLQFSLQSGNERLCVSCHPVLIWALMYFINKGLLSSLTVVTPWFQCRMHAGRGYTINNQLAAITPF